MIKLPVKDAVTIPWMSQREIPAIKAALSAWRKLRKNREAVAEIRLQVYDDGWPHAYALAIEEVLGRELEKLAAIDERLREEAKNAKAKA